MTPFKTSEVSETSEVSASRCPRDQALLMEDSNPVHGGTPVPALDLAEGQRAIQFGDHPMTVRWYRNHHAFVEQHLDAALKPVNKSSYRAQPGV